MWAAEGFDGDFMVKGALLRERLEVVVAPGRKSSVVCFVEVTSFSIFCAEPGKKCDGGDGFGCRASVESKARAGETAQEEAVNPGPVSVMNSLGTN
jgi:hypothetical protein